MSFYTPRIQYGISLLILGYILFTNYMNFPNENNFLLIFSPLLLMSAYIFFKLLKPTHLLTLSTEGIYLDEAKKEFIPWEKMDYIQSIHFAPVPIWRLHIGLFESFECFQNKKLFRFPTVRESLFYIYTFDILMKRSLVTSIEENYTIYHNKYGYPSWSQSRRNDRGLKALVDIKDIVTESSEIESRHDRHDLIALLDSSIKAIKEEHFIPESQLKKIFDHETLNNIDTEIQVQNSKNTYDPYSIALSMLYDK